MVHRPEPVPARPGPAPRVRTCVGCRVRTADTELLRVVLAGGDLIPDPRRRMPGRGAWIHPRTECLAKAEKRRAFPRALRAEGELAVEGLRSAIDRIAGETGTGYSRAVEDRKQVDPS